MKMRRKARLQQRSCRSPSDWVEGRCSYQPSLDGVYATWSRVSEHGACLLGLGRRSISVAGVFAGYRTLIKNTFCRLRPTQSQLKIDVNLEGLTSSSRPARPDSVRCDGLRSRSDLRTSFLIIA